jgi:uncharacterized protein (DUF58 family)
MRPAAATALLGLTLTLSAAVFDAEPLYVPGTALTTLALAAVVWVVASAQGVRVKRTVGARRVQEDEPVAIEVLVDAGRLPLPAGSIEDDLLPEPAPVASGQRRARLNIRVRFARRGRKTLAPPRVVVRDPFGLASVPVPAPEGADVLVLPRVERVRTPRGDGRGPGTALRSGRPAVAAEVDLDGLRPHREGAPASRIYWPGLARWGELMERRLRAEGDTRPLVLLDLRAPERREAADAAVRATASLAVALARDGGCAVLLPGDRRPTVLEPTLAGWPALHARLAVIETEAVPSLSGVAARRGPVLYVAARVLARPPRALAHAPGGGRVLVVPGSLPGRTPLLEVAGCRGYEIGGERRSARRRMAAEAGAAAAAASGVPPAAGGGEAP